MMIECPHCHMETEHKVIDHINIDRNPELRAKVQDLSVFRVKCPNCGETVLAVHPCLYHDMANQFMVWLWTEDGQVPKAEFDPLAGYTLRVTDSLNTLDERTGDFRFVAVLSDGAEQYAAMPGAAYQRLHADVETYLYTPGGEFSRIDMTWAHQALELLHEMG